MTFAFAASYRPRLASPNTAEGRERRQRRLGEEKDGNGAGEYRCQEEEEEEEEKARDMIQKEY